MRFLHWFICCFLSACIGYPFDEDRHKLVIVLMDGFRWDYVHQQPLDRLPGFATLMGEGVRAEWMNAIFPAISCPSWMTIATGLHVENHGIVGNDFFDNERQIPFNLFDPQTTQHAFWWKNSEPIWTTATKYGLKAAVYFWARCDVPINGVVPEVCEPFQFIDGWYTFDEYMDKALRRLEDGFDLVMVYTGHVDNIGHDYGPESIAVKEAVRDVDRVLFRFLQKLKARSLNETVNVMVLSDHGMTRARRNTEATYYRLDDYLDLKDVQMILDRASFFSIIPFPGREDKVYRDLSRMKGVQVYRKRDIPEFYHYRNAKHAQEITVQALPGYVVEGSQSPKQVPRDNPNINWPGLHGYDPTFTDMNAIFMGWGPDFEDQLVVDPIDMVDVYQLMTYVLKIPPAPHNGTWRHVRYMLSEATGIGMTWIPYIVILLLINLFI